MDVKLTDKQKMFCLEYLTDLNGTQAAIRAGYSKASARQLAADTLSKTYIRKYLDELLEQHSLGKKETIKLISDIAQGSLNDYFIEKEQVAIPKVVKPLGQINKEIKQEIEDEEKFFTRSGVNDEDSVKNHHAGQQRRKLEILRNEIELERNSDARRVVDGEPYLETVSQLDMPALVRDRQRGRIKSITPTEHGMKVEMYAADAALRDIGKVHGIFEADNKQAATTIQPMNDSQVDKILEQLRKK